MPSIASDALVLRTYDLGETSKVVVLLTRERGKLRAVAKGVRGPRGRYHSALEPLSELRVGLYARQGAPMHRLGECELIRSAFSATDQGLETALMISYLADLLDAFSPEGEAEDAVYRLAVAVIRAAEKGWCSLVLARYMEAWLLKLHGLYPPLDRCASCARPLLEDRLAYHPPARGFICATCGPAGGPLLSGAVRGFLLEAFQKGPQSMPRVFPREAGAVEAFHQDLIVDHLERRLPSYGVLKDIARRMHG